MKLPKFKQLLEVVDHLQTEQFRELREHINQVDSINFVASDLEIPYHEIECPHCKSNLIKRWGKRSDLQRYRCKVCKRTFNSLTGTPLAYLHKKGRWLDFAQCLIDGYSVRKSAELCHVNKNTTFRWRHRFLQNMTFIKATKLKGIVEIEDIYFFESQKGSKQISRKPRNRGVIKSKSCKPEVCVLISRDRNDNTFDKIIDKLNVNQLNREYSKIISKDSLLCAENKTVYTDFSNENNIHHASLKLSTGVTVTKNVVNVNNVCDYVNRLYTWMIRFHGVATKYLDNYLSWYRCLDELKNNITPSTLLIRAKIGGIYQSQPNSYT